MIYFSPSARGFYHADVHGPRQVLAPHPGWKRPRGPKGAALEHPQSLQDNPDTRIPADAIEISAVEHHALLAAQAGGHTIVVGQDGRPTTEPPPPPDYARRRRRAYGSAGDQLEMIYRAMKAAGDDNEFTRHVDQVKAAHPKPAD